MPIERKSEYKPLSFSTTMRNPTRIADFLKCILPFEGQILTNDVIHEVVIRLITNKLYHTMYQKRDAVYKSIYLDDEQPYTREQVEDIIAHSPQQHKEKGFDKGWPSRFDTWYKLPMEFGFIYYAMDEPIVISTTGHMLIDACNEEPANDEKIRNVFLNALVKYQTNNPFRKNSNDNSPLILLLQVIDLLKKDPEENDAGIFRSELSLIICWPNRDAYSLYLKIKEIRKKYGFTYGDEIIYDICLSLLGATPEQKNRFKIGQITGESVDEFIRKMRITGVISLRGNGRFIDYNTFEIDKINYILENYSDYESYKDKQSFFNYIGTIDSNIISLKREIEFNTLDDIRIKTLDTWVTNYTKEEIIDELRIVCGKGESKNSILRLIDKPTRLEFLTSIALKQHFSDLIVKPNYHIDDEGLPTFTASGGMADIECFDDTCNSLVEVTLMCASNQAKNELPAITRHLQEAISQNPEITIFSILVAPTIHQDSIYMADFSKYKYNIDILTFNISEFIVQLTSNNKIIELLNT